MINLTYSSELLKKRQGDLRIAGVFTYKEWVDEEHECIKMQLKGPCLIYSEIEGCTRPAVIGTRIRCPLHEAQIFDKRKAFSLMKNAIKREVCYRNFIGLYGQIDLEEGHPAWKIKSAALFIYPAPNDIQHDIDMFSWEDVEKERLAIGNRSALQATHALEDGLVQEYYFIDNDLNKAYLDI